MFQNSRINGAHMNRHERRAARATTKAGRQPQHKERMTAKKANRHERQATRAIEQRGRRKSRESGDFIMSWYESPEEFEKARKLDPESYEGKTYEEMNAALDEVCEHRLDAVKVPIRVDECVAWCQENNLVFGGESRLMYIRQLWSGKL